MSSLRRSRMSLTGSSDSFSSPISPRAPNKQAIALTSPSPDLNKDHSGVDMVAPVNTSQGAGGIRSKYASNHSIVEQVQQDRNNNNSPPVANIMEN